jgi:hypothetical protein
MQSTSPPARHVDEESRILQEFATANLDNVIPQLARDRKTMQRIESIVRGLQTSHDLILGDARGASALPNQSVHLVVTSPPYWTLKRYHDH